MLQLCGSPYGSVGLCVCARGRVWLDVEAGPYEDLLIKRIFHDSHYYQPSRPVQNESSAIEVKFGLTLQQIIDVVSQAWCSSRLSSVFWVARIWNVICRLA